MSVVSFLCCSEFCIRQFLGKKFLYLVSKRLCCFLVSMQSQAVGKTDIKLTLQRQLSDLREKKVKSEVGREEVDTELMTATSVAPTMEDIHTELNGISESLSQPPPPAPPEAVQQECLSPSQPKAPAILQQVPTHSQSDCTDTYSVGRKESENGAEDVIAKLHTREKITQHWSFPLKTGAKHTQSGCVLESQAISKSVRPTLRPVNVVVQKHMIETRKEEEAKQPVARKLPTELYDCTPYYPCTTSASGGGTTPSTSLHEEITTSSLPSSN